MRQVNKKAYSLNAGDKKKMGGTPKRQCRMIHLDRQYEKQTRQISVQSVQIQNPTQFPSNNHWLLQFKRVKHS